MSDDSIHELAAGYTLDSLDQVDRTAFEAHLARCEECRETVATLSGAATALAYAAEGPAPPAELRERLLAAARVDRATVVPLRRRWATRSTAAVAAAACLALGLGLWATLGGSGGSRAREPQTIALSGASGTVQVDRVGHAVLTVNHVAAAPAGKTYEAWVIPKGRQASRAGLFRGGSGRVIVSLEPRVPAGSTVAVTLERAGGVDAPTGKIRFSAVVPA